MKKLHPRMVALVEVVAVFLLAVALFQGIRTAAFSRWESAILPGQRLFLLEYGAVLGVVMGVMALTRQNWEHYGLTLKHRKLQFHVIAVGFLPALTLGGVLGLVDWTMWRGAAVVAAVAVAMVFLAGWLLRDGTMQPGLMLMMALLGLAPGAIKMGGAESALIKTLYFYLLVGPAEELLFRGYMQSRLQAAYGKPYRFFGVRWGWGLLIASGLFGLWHVVWQPMTGGAWLHGMWTFFAGLLFGYVRERSQGLLAASFLHSVMNYVPVMEWMVFRGGSP